MPVRSRRGSGRPRWSSPVKLGAAALFVLIAGWLTLAISIAANLRDDRPDGALALTPWDAGALASRAEQRLATAGVGPVAAAAARRDALATLTRDSTQVVAWRTFALTEAAAGRQADASRLFRMSERLSRRDLPTQLWLIEEQVGKGDVAGALVHYDVALRTNTNSYDTLIPIMVAASGNPAVVDPLGRLLASSPPWSNYFWYKLAQAPPDLDQTARLLEVARRGGPVNNPEMVGVLIKAMVARGAFGAAIRSYAVQSGARHGSIKGVFGGDFERDGAYPPLDWELSEAPELGAEPRADRAGTGRVLTAFVTADHDGVAARQLLILPAGAFRLRFRSGTTDAPAAKLTWQLVCGGDGGAALLSQPVDLTRPAVLQQVAFTVPAGCPAQWLSLNAAAPNPDQNEAWVDAVTVASARDGRAIN